MSPGQLVGGSKNASSLLGSTLLYYKLKYSDARQLLELSGLRCRDRNLLVSKVDRVILLGSILAATNYFLVRTWLAYLFGSSTLALAAGGNKKVLYHKDRKLLSV